MKYDTTANDIRRCGRCLIPPASSHEELLHDGEGHLHLAPGPRLLGELRRAQRARAEAVVLHLKRKLAEVRSRHLELLELYRRWCNWFSQRWAKCVFDIWIGSGCWWVGHRTQRAIIISPLHSSMPTRQKTNTYLLRCSLVWHC